MGEIKWINLGKACKDSLRQGHLLLSGFYRVVVGGTGKVINTQFGLEVLTLLC